MKHIKFQSVMRNPKAVALTLIASALVFLGASPAAFADVIFTNDPVASAAGVDVNSTLWKLGAGSDVQPTLGTGGVPNDYIMPSTVANLSGTQTYNNVVIAYGTNTTGPAAMNFFGDSLSVGSNWLLTLHPGATNSTFATGNTAHSTFTFTNSISPASPGLILNGGMIEGNGSFVNANICSNVLYGIIQAASGTTSYMSFSGSQFNAAGQSDLNFWIPATITGNGSIMFTGGTYTNGAAYPGGFQANSAIFTNAHPASTFSGTWIVEGGLMTTSTTAVAGAYGTNCSFVVDNLAPIPAPTSPAFFNNATNPSAELIFTIPIVSTGTLKVNNTGLLSLKAACAFSAVTIGGTPLTAGNYSAATLISTYPANLDGTSTGTLTVLSTGPIDHYSVTTSASTNGGRQTFSTIVVALDASGVQVNDNSTVVTMTSDTTHAQFDANGDGTYGDNTQTLVAGQFSINTRDNTAESVNLTATSTGGKTGTTGTPVTVVSPVIVKADTGTLMNSTDWSPNTVPANGLVGLFDSTISAVNEGNLTLGGAVTLDSLYFGGNLHGPVTNVSDGNTLTLGIADTNSHGFMGIDMSLANQDVTLNANIAFATNQTWNVAAGRTLTTGGLLSGTGRNLTKSGLGKLVVSGANNTFGAGFGNSVFLADGVLEMTAAGALGVANGNVVCVSPGNVTFEMASDTPFSGGVSISPPVLPGTLTIMVDTLTPGAPGVTNSLNSMNQLATAATQNNEQVVNIVPGPNMQPNTPYGLTFSGTDGDLGRGWGVHNIVNNGTGIGTVTFNDKLSLNYGFSKKGNGTLVFNNLTRAGSRGSGPGTEVDDGILVVAGAFAPQALASAAALPLIMNGGTFQMAMDTGSLIRGTAVQMQNSATIQSDVLTPGGAGVSYTNQSLTFFGPCTLTVGPGPHVGSGTAVVAFQGAVTLNAAGTLKVTNSAVAAGVAIVGAVNGNYLFTKAGNGLLVMSGPSGDTAGVEIDGGTVQLGDPGALGPAANATLTFGAASSGKLQINGFSPTLVGLTGDSTATIENGVPGGAALTLNNTGSTTFAGVIQNGAAGTVSLTINSGTQTLSGANTYTDPTSVQGGTLLLGQGGSIGASGVSVSSIFGNATLGSATTTTTTIGASTTYGGGAFASFTGMGGVSSAVGKISVNGDLAMNDNAININVTGAALHNGTYRLLDCTGNLSDPGTFPAPTFTGIGSIATISVTTGAAGHVDLVVTGAAQAPVTSMNITSGGVINYSGGGGTNFVLLSSANVAAPLSTWTPIKTNLATPGSFTVPIGPAPKAFYSIQSK